LNDGKATLRIGDRVPIATGSFSGAVSGTSVSPLVSTQFQYLDVGVNIDITPHIHSDQEVTLKMSLEISSVTGQQTIGGITQPVIGQRRIDHETRLSDGEVNLLGGILQDSETQSMSGYPWLSKLPILRYFFSQDNRERINQEIVFALTPHIVRGKEVTDENVRMLAIGTGSQIELRHKPPASTPEHTPDAAKPQPTAPAVPAPATKPQTPAPPAAATKPAPAHTAAATKPPPVPGAPPTAQ
jgi:general secretion pathway protein D